jgi:DNA-binding NarL/FixJ family response regulator
MDPINVLIVEDNFTFRTALREILKTQFPAMAIEEAADGDEALRKIHTCPPTLVFMDIKLPGENGLEVTRKIKAEFPDVIVMILTSYDLPEYRDAAIRYGANHFIIKGSSTFEEIYSLIERIIASGRIRPPCA